MRRHRFNRHINHYGKLIALFMCMVSCSMHAQTSDTLNGYERKVSGEEINYFSHMHEFAKTALLTRATGAMPIVWEAPVYAGEKETVTYELLMGHSTGTSSGDRKFDVALNGKSLFTITTLMKKKGAYVLSDKAPGNVSYRFVHQEYDINGDGFGRLFISVPSSFVKEKASFSIKGQNENSRDWLMIFMYQRGLKVIAEPTNLITRAENKRQLNLFIDNPYPDSTSLSVKTKDVTLIRSLHNGYNTLSLPAYQRSRIGEDTLYLIIYQKDTLEQIVTLNPVRDLTFYIIHHSHNDIGYSHLQTEVEQIQNQNIRSAIRWIKQHENELQMPVWHIESLWAVENFLQSATLQETTSFVEAVHKGQLVLSANYANILTGLCQPEELNWMLEYAKMLEKKYGFQIQNAMITDIPGISYSGLSAYANNHIPYLSLGPNYVGTLPDKGDRVGGVIREQGDQVFYWKPERTSDQKVLVWTAGKGYSFFHGISENQKQASWEQRISNYCNELQQTHYPYNIVQLRYTKNSDNGPVDTSLTDFVTHWNEQYLVPRLNISSVNTLFEEFERRYAKVIPVRTGEISPYWEDGAYSTAKEEMDNRELVLKTIALEKYAKDKNKYEANTDLFYRLHRDIVLFHEHTWGSWCSISDPELPFTTKQWDIKKQFLDSALWYYAKLSSKLSFTYRAASAASSASKKMISDIAVDQVHGGLSEIRVDGKNIVTLGGGNSFFEMIYSLGIDPSQVVRTSKVKIKLIENSAIKKVINMTAELPSMKNITVSYTLWKQEGRVTCKCAFDKQIEKGKESLHLAMPFAMHYPAIRYGNNDHLIEYGKDQLRGSNHEFVCVEDKLRVSSESLTAIISCPKIALYEIGGMVDENKINGVKTWSTGNRNTSEVFLYVLNNYWHTNYKAYQTGRIEFEAELRFEGND